MDLTKKHNLYAAGKDPHKEILPEGIKRLVIVRHGNDSDQDLLDRQVQYAISTLQNVLPGIEPDAIFYSDIERAKRTASSVRLALANEGNQQPSIPFIESDWLREEAGGNLGFKGLQKKLRSLEEGLNNVFLVTHSTTGLVIARALKANSDNMSINAVFANYVGILVLDIPVESWKDIKKDTHARIVKAITEKGALDKDDLTEARDKFIAQLTQ